MLQIKRLHPDAIPPVRSNANDAGLDLHCILPEGFFLRPQERSMFRTGWAFGIPQGYVGLILPRSGLANRKGIQILGGVVDSDYRDEVRVLLFNSGKIALECAPGDRLAQIVILPIALWTPHVVEEFTEEQTARGMNGFGSTGR